LPEKSKSELASCTVVVSMETVRGNEVPRGRLVESTAQKSTFKKAGQVISQIG
jgi:hypothetical protein